jgi:hypothetical protein
MPYDRLKVAREVLEDNGLELDGHVIKSGAVQVGFLRRPSWTRLPAKKEHENISGGPYGIEIYTGIPEATRQRWREVEMGLTYRWVDERFPSDNKYQIHGHKAFDVIGQKVLIFSPKIWLLGVFQESDITDTTLEGGRPALDFVYPIYRPTDFQEVVARANLTERINEDSPILSIIVGLDHPKLRYIKKVNNAHYFLGDLSYSAGTFINDGHELYPRYAKSLEEAGIPLTL